MAWGLWSRGCERSPCQAPQLGPLPSAGVPKVTTLSEHCPQSPVLPRATPTGFTHWGPRHASRAQERHPALCPRLGSCNWWTLGQLSWLPTGHLGISSLHTKLQVPQRPTTTLCRTVKSWSSDTGDNHPQPPLLPSKESCARQSPRNATLSGGGILRGPQGSAKTGAIKYSLCHQGASRPPGCKCPRPPAPTALCTSPGVHPTPQEGSGTESPGAIHSK